MAAALVAVSLGAGGLLTASAAGSPGASSFVPITPCRLMDTRSSTLPQIGPRATPIGANETYTALVWGTNGKCTIPSTATAVSLNVTFVNPSVGGYVSVFPADKPWPGTSNLNFSAQQAAAPNAVTSALSADGRLAFLNAAGTVDLIADIVGYYEPSSSGPSGPQGPQGAKGDTGDPGPRPAQVVWVATSGGDFTSVTAALNSITNNSAAIPYVIKIAPGVYTEATGIDMKDYVDIEGSGQNVTTISASSTATDNTTVRVAGVRHGEIRNLTISNTGGAGPNVGLRFTTVTPAGGVDISNVTVTSTSTSDSYGIYVQSSAPDLTHVTVSANSAAGSGAAYPFTNNNSSPTMTDVQATATAAVSGGPASRVIGVYNQNASAPTMTNVTATAKDAGSGAWGVYNEGGSSPTMTNVTATAIGGGVNVGVGNTGASSPRMTDVTATGTGGSYAIGVDSNTSSATLVNVTATATGGSLGSMGVWSQDSNLTIRTSVITGTPTIYLGVGSTVKVADTMLAGAVTNLSGTLTCVGVHNAAFVALSATCT